VPQMTQDELEKIIDWYLQLKVEASNYCKDRAVEDLLYSAVQLGVPFKNVEAIKKGGKNARHKQSLKQWVESSNE
jgi:hypothetical protein